MDAPSITFSYWVTRLCFVFEKAKGPGYKGNCECMEYVQGRKGNDKGAWSQSPLLPYQAWSNKENKQILQLRQNT